MSAVSLGYPAFCQQHTKEVPMSITKILDYTIRIAGLAALFLGLLFWIGRFYEYLHVHMRLGVVTVIALWVLAAMCFRKGAASVGRIAAATIWGLVTMSLGIGQTQMLIGDYHWIIQAAHLLMGLGAIAFGAILSKSLARKSIN
jgi:hypothetical protein